MEQVSPEAILPPDDSEAVAVAAVSAATQAIKQGRIEQAAADQKSITGARLGLIARGELVMDNSGHWVYHRPE